MCKVELSFPRSILPLLPLIHLTLFSPHGHFPFPPFCVCDSRRTEQFSSALWSYCSGYRWLDSEVLTSAIDHGLLWGWVIKNLPSILFKLQEPLRRALQHVTIPSVVTGKQQTKFLLVLYLNLPFWAASTGRESQEGTFEPCTALPLHFGALSSLHDEVSMPLCSLIVGVKECHFCCGCAELA